MRPELREEIKEEEEIDWLRLLIECRNDDKNDAEYSACSLTACSFSSDWKSSSSLRADSADERKSGEEGSRTGESEGMRGCGGREDMEDIEGDAVVFILSVRAGRVVWKARASEGEKEEEKR